MTTTTERLAELEQTVEDIIEVLHDGESIRALKAQRQEQRSQSQVPQTHGLPAGELAPKGG